MARQSRSHPSCGVPSAKPRLMTLMALGWSPASRASSSPTAKTAASAAWKLSAPFSRRVLAGSRDVEAVTVGGAITEIALLLVSVFRWVGPVRSAPTCRNGFVVSAAADPLARCRRSGTDGLRKDLWPTLDPRTREVLLWDCRNLASTPGRC